VQVLAAAVRIERFDPSTDETRLRACHEMQVSAQPVDDPNSPPDSYAAFWGWWIYGMAGVPQQTWLATSESGTPVGWYVLELPDRENKGIAFAMPFVALPARRQAIGTQLVAHVAEQAEQAGRTLVKSAARVGGPGAAFAAAIGARPTMRDARRVLDVGPALHALLPPLRAQAAAHAVGYSLRRWSGPVPDDLAEHVCSLFMAMADAPREENVEPEEWDPERLRLAEARGIAQGTRWYEVAAIHQESGEMAALTQVNVDPAIDDWAFQDITVVTRPHRGHHLGLYVKVAMLEWLAETEPRVRRVMTYNAVGNEHMIAVNAALGHRVTDYFDGFELDVEAARSLDRMPR
jgi:RimJ/RimL family protein N-acetyltransferase/GNAT superfamily N-acetyltransferase